MGLKLNSALRRLTLTGRAIRIRYAMFVSVRNTFLHEIVDLQALESGDEQIRRRAKSVGSVLLQEQEVIALEQASISSLKEWFAHSSGMQEQAPSLKKSLSNSSLSTMFME